MAKITRDPVTDRATIHLNREESKKWEEIVKLKPKANKRLREAFAVARKALVGVDK